MKKLPTLHILNGDATLSAFESAKLPGQVLVWREILSEGPAIASLPEPAFWEKRQAYITQTYGETTTAYKEKVLDELSKINAAGAIFEVILWFDSDLMCQVNLLYLLHRMHLLHPDKVCVCTPHLPDNISLKKGEGIQQLFEARKEQTEAQLIQAHELWQLYASSTPLKLQHYLQKHEDIAPDLRQAMQLHLSRFPDCRTALGNPETELLKLIKDGAKTKEELLQQFWKHHPGYGFGDWQLLQLLKRLQPELVHERDQLELSTLGNNVLQGEAVTKLKPYWLGGYKVDEANNLCYNSLTQQLEVFTSS